jgi:four helix bundle protein
MCGNSGRMATRRTKGSRFEVQSSRLPCETPASSEGLFCALVSHWQVGSFGIFYLLRSAKRGVSTTIEQFEDIEAWKLGRELTRAIYRVSKSGEFSRDYALRDQIRRAAISITSNIAEGFERGGNREFLQALAIAKGSAGEVRSQLYTACDESYISDAEFEGLRNQCLKVSRTLSGFMTYLQRTSLAGAKYRSTTRVEKRKP